MALFFTRFKTHHNYNLILNWSKLISITASAQLIVQAVGFLSGILIIRLLPIDQYAYYTIANTMLGTMSILSDGGISTGVMAQGGKFWQDRTKMGIVLATGLNLRRKFAIISLIVSIPILFYLLLHNGASILTASLVSIALVPAFFAALSDSLLEIVPKLHQTIMPLQFNQLRVGLGRLFLTGLTMLIFPWAFVAVFASGIPRIWGNFQLRKIVYGIVEKDLQPDKDIRNEILNLVKRVMPGAIYFCISGQITIWLISIFGNTKSIAELGALGRLGMLLSFFSSIISTLVIPRFAKLDNKKNILLSNYFKILLLLFLFTSFIILGFYLFPIPFLMILGKGFKGLAYELLLCIIGSCIFLISGIIYFLNLSRGWVMSPTLSITIQILSIIIFASILDLSNLLGVLYLNITMGLISFFQHFMFSLFKINMCYCHLNDK